jgi:hypothetical protein
MASQQKTVIEFPMGGGTCSPTQNPAHVWPHHPNRCHEALARRHIHQGDEGTKSEHHARNPHCHGYEGPKGSGAKAVRSNVHDACFPKHFRAPNNIIKYDGKTNPCIWLGDYCLTCWAGGVDDDRFIIQFLPIYLANTARAWLNHLLRSTIDSWEDLKDFFTDNFQGTYMWPTTPGILRVTDRSQVDPSGIKSGDSPRSALNSLRLATSTSSRHSGLTLIAIP